MTAVAGKSRPKGNRENLGSRDSSRVVQRLVILRGWIKYYHVIVGVVT
jgi:hypothetical protein